MNEYTEGDFEYDREDVEDSEDSEAGDEQVFEASDEADEGDEAFAPEGDEAFAPEGDEGSDEGDESTLGAEMEAQDEADTEGDEALPFGEAVQMSASARLRANREQYQRERYAQKAVLAQRNEARRAAAVQRSITERIRAIPVRTSPTVATVGMLQGSGVVTATLPNGRRTRMKIDPTMAPIREVNRLRAVVLANERRQAVAIRSNTKAITSLASAQASAVRQLTAQQVKSDKELSRQLVEANTRLDKRISKELSGGTGALDKHNKRFVKVLRRERRRAVMNNVLLATSIPMFIAYGEREDPFKSVDNYILTGSTLFWLLGDDVISSYSKNTGGMQTFASFWSYAGFAANVGGLAWWFRNKQTERFIADITTFDVTKGAKIDVKAQIKEDGVEDFEKDQHAVVASFVGAPTKGGALQAALDPGTGMLTLNVVQTGADALTGNATVAWIVDVKAQSKLPLLTA